MDSSQVIPGSVELSSGGRGWNGIEATRVRHRVDDFNAPPFPDHLAILHLGPPLDVAGDVGEGVGQRVRVREGDLIVIPAGAASEWRWGGPGEVDAVHMHLEPALFREAVAGSGVDPDGIEVVGAVGERDPRVERIGLSLLAELENGGLGSGLYAESLANLLAVELLRHHSSLGRKAKRRVERESERTVGLSPYALKATTDYMNDNLAGDLTVADIAGVAYMSPYHFSRLFKRSTGHTPHQYVVRLRLKEARSLLIEGNLSVAEVAHAVGFFDQAHFSKSFKRLTGSTPGSLLPVKSKNLQRG